MRTTTSFAAPMLQIYLFFILLPFALSIPSTLSDTIGCFAQSANPRQRLIPTTFKACYELSKFLIHHDKSQGGITFSRKPGVGFQVPEHWVSGNCVLAIDVHSADDEDTLSFKDIAVEAGAVMVRCVAKPPHLGGTQFVGRKKVMNVTIIGFSGRPHVDARPFNELLLHGLGAGNATTA